MNARRVLLALGVAITGAGLALTVAPRAARAVPAKRQTVVLVGVGALLGALVVAWRRRAVGIERVETGDPETLVEHPAPGDGARTTFELASGLRVTGSGEKVRERLADAAVAVVRRRYDCSQADARAMLEAGEWTDDEFAAAFLAGEGGRDQPRIPPRARLGRDSAFTYRARRTVDAIVDLAEMEVER